MHRANPVHCPSEKRLGVWGNSGAHGGDHAAGKRLYPLERRRSPRPLEGRVDRQCCSVLRRRSDPAASSGEVRRRGSRTPRPSFDLLAAGSATFSYRSPTEELSKTQFVDEREGEFQNCHRRKGERRGGRARRAVHAIHARREDPNVL